MIEVFCRDSRGEIIVMSSDGTITYRSSEAETYAGPLQLWVLNDKSILSRKVVDQHYKWWPV